MTSEVEYDNSDRDYSNYDKEDNDIGTFDFCYLEENSNQYTNLDQINKNTNF